MLVGNTLFSLHAARLACRPRHLPVMHFRLNVFCSFRNGCTALVLAVRFLAAADGRVHVVKELIAAGSDVDAKNDNGQAPAPDEFAPAFRTGSPTCARRGTVLMLAAFFGYSRVVELLIAAGAPVTAKDNGGQGRRAALRFAQAARPQ